MRSYYSFGQIVLPTTRTTTTSVTSTRRAPPSTPETGAPRLMTTVLAQPLAPATAVMATQPTVAPVEYSKLLLSTAAQRSTGTKPTEIDIIGKMAQEIKPGVAPVGVPTPSAPPPPPPADPSAFAAYCASEKGTLVNGVCTFPDGAKAVFKNGNAVCVNVVGRCAPGVTEEKKPGRGALMIGAAALAALMFLR